MFSWVLVRQERKKLNNKIQILLLTDKCDARRHFHDETLAGKAFQFNQQQHESFTDFRMNLIQLLIRDFHQNGRVACVVIVSHYASNELCASELDDWTIDENRRRPAIGKAQATQLEIKIGIWFNHFQALAIDQFGQQWLILDEFWFHRCKDSHCRFRIGELDQPVRVHGPNRDDAFLVNNFHHAAAQFISIIILGHVVQQNVLDSIARIFEQFDLLHFAPQYLDVAIPQIDWSCAAPTFGLCENDSI